MEKGPEKKIIIPEETYVAFNSEVEAIRKNNLFLATRPPKYEVGSLVWTPWIKEFEEESMKVVKVDAGIYLVCTEDGECIVCKESDIQSLDQ